MKIVKTLTSGLIWLLVLIGLVLPTILVYQLSQAEMEEYAVPEQPILRETAIGKIAEAEISDIEECFNVSGTFISTSYAFMELDYEQPSRIRWIVDVGEEIQEGMILGYYYGEEVISSLSGILVERDVSVTEDAYIRCLSLHPIVLSCRVDDDILHILKHNDLLYTENGEEVTMEYFSNVKNEDGSSNVYLLIQSEKYFLGEEISNLYIFTGRIFYKATVLPSDCVYQKISGDEEPWYVRQVTMDGDFIAEIEVEVGYSNNNVVCVYGIEPGTYYDTGYKAVVGE